MQPSAAAEQPLEGRSPEAPEPADGGLSVVEGNFGKEYFLWKNAITSPTAATSISAAEDEKALDRYEGFPNFYYKKELTLPIKGIRTGKIRKRRVFVYIMHEDRPIGIPSIPYMQTCIQGYDDFGFDRLVLIDAYLKCGEEHHEGK